MSELEVVHLVLEASECRCELEVRSAVTIFAQAIATQLSIGRSTQRRPHKATPTNQASIARPFCTACYFLRSALRNSQEAHLLLHNCMLLSIAVGRKLSVSLTLV